MIIVKLSGGLGNQLFQYSFGRYLSLKHGTELKFDSHLRINNPNFTPRSLGLSKYKLNLSFVNDEELKKYKLFNNGFMARLERKIIQKIPFLNKRMRVEDTFKIIKKEVLSNECYYDGYWQSEYYFDSIADLIRRDLQLNFELDEANKIIENQINNSASVSLHIRRGDYLAVSSNAKIYNVCSLEYYQSAMNYLNDKYKELTFFIFSDDISWAKENFKNGNFKIVDINQNNPHADLYLMSKCKHNIIANSSFSWWGAWLNSFEDKVVVSPKKWYKDSTTNKNAINSIIPNSWITF